MLRVFLALLIIAIIYLLVDQRQGAAGEEVEEISSNAIGSQGETRGVCRNGKSDELCPDPNIKYYFYANSSFRIPVTEENVTALEDYGWTCSKINTVIIHGGGNDETTVVMKLLVDGHLDNGTYNVFAVNWIYYASGACYFGALKSMYPVGKCVASFVNALLDKCDQKPVRLVGHSLGAHVAGAIGISVRNKCSVWIVGTDPGIILDGSLDNRYRLDEDDACYVETIVTNCDGYGNTCDIRSGGLQFCVNGGKFQTACADKGVNLCSHRQAICYLVHALRNATEAPYVGYRTSFNDCSAAAPGTCSVFSNGSTAALGETYPHSEKGIYCLDIPEIDLACGA